MAETGEWGALAIALSYTGILVAGFFVTNWFNRTITRLSMRFGGLPRAENPEAGDRISGVRASN